MFYITLFIIIYLINTTVQNNEITFYSDQSGTSFTSFYINSSILRLPIRISFSDPFNYIISNKNSITKDPISSSPYDSIIIQNHTLSAQLISYSLCFNLNLNCIHNISFYYIKQDLHYKLYDTISLSKNLLSNNFSLLHKLKSKQMINKLEFSFIPNSQYFGKVYFGRTPQNEINNKYKYTCKSSFKLKEWGCELNQIIFSNKTSFQEQIIYHNNNTQNIRFETLYNKFYVPYDFFNFISKNVFYQFVKEGKCAVVVEEKGDNHFECACGELKDFPSTSFVFEGVVYELGVFLMFEQKIEGNRCDNLFYYNNENEMWIIGNRFLHNYISVFDVENGGVTFYTDNPMRNLFFNEDVYFEKKKTKEIIIYIVGILCVFSIFFEFYLLRKQHIVI